MELDIVAPPGCINIPVLDSTTLQPSHLIVKRIYQKKTDSSVSLYADFEEPILRY